MKKAVLLTMSFVALTAAVAARADQKKANEKFCAGAAEYQSEVAELKAMGEHSTVAEVRSAGRRISAAVDKMQAAAGKMDTPTAKRFLDATHKVDKDIGDISDDATLKQVREKMRADVKEAQAAGEQLASEAGCPQAAPQMPPPESPAPER